MPFRFSPWSELFLKISEDHFKYKIIQKLPHFSIRNSPNIIRLRFFGGLL